MPGARNVRLLMLRALIAVFCTTSRVIEKDRSPLCAWIIGASPVTITVSSSVPTSIASAPRATRSPGWTITFDRSRVLNPSIFTRTEYVSAATVGKTKSPEAFVIVSSLSDFVALVSVTVAPGMAPPLVSCTDPVTDPAPICAQAGTPMRSTP